MKKLTYFRKGTENLQRIHMKRKGTIVIVSFSFFVRFQKTNSQKNLQSSDF